MRSAGPLFYLPVGEWGPTNVGIKPGDLVEVTDGWSELREITGIVEAIEGNAAIVQPVDDTDEWFTPKGERIRVHRNSLVKLPTPTQLRAGKRKAREQHLEAKRLSNPQVTIGPGNIRRFKQN